MQNLFLVPSSIQNIKETITSRITIELAEKFLNSRDLDNLKTRILSSSGFHCWAMKPGKKNSCFSPMRNGDIVLFKPNKTDNDSGVFKYRGEVIYKVFCPDLGDFLWSEGSEWHYIYFLEKIKKIHIRHSDLAKKLNYENKNPKVLPGVFRVDPNKITNYVLSDHGNIDDFLTSLNDLSEPITTSEKNINTRKNPIRRTTTSPLQRVIAYQVPNELRSLINDVRQLQRDHNHLERDNESLVEKFFVNLGYSSVSEIKFRRNNIDILISNNNEPLITIEVKRSWSLNKMDMKTLRQAFNYSMESGTRYVMISNGDYYALYDRNLGRTYENMFKFEFTLTKLKEKDLDSVDYLKKTELT